MIQQNLFNDPIKSISYDNDYILESIIDLHCQGGIEVDLTYSIGNFYKGHVKKPKFYFDLFPRAPKVIPANFENIPLKKESVNSIMFDPPFAMGGETNGFLQKRFTVYKNIIDLKESYKKNIHESYRILKKNGIYIFKCQDMVTSGVNHFVHTYVMNEAVNAGFIPIDLFVLLAKQRMISGQIKKQQHARKFHSYFWVFRKK